MPDRPAGNDENVIFVATARTRRTMQTEFDDVGEARFESRF